MAKFEVYMRVPLHAARGKKVKSKWVEDYKDVGGSRIVRSRLVAMEFAWDTRFDTFAGTPPLKKVCLGLALAAVLVGPSGRKKMMMVGLYDVSVAFYHAMMD